MRVAICEDDAADAAEIRCFLEDHFKNNGFIGNIDVYASCEELLSAFSPGAFDVVFLDIHFSLMSGVEAARMMRSRDPNCALVFITANPGHMPEGFALRAASYVVKPITREQMDRAFLQCRSVFLKNARYIEVKTGGHSVRIPLPKVLYVGTMNKAASIYTPEGVVKTYMPIEEIERQLGGKPFLRCHRAYVVNMLHVDSVLVNSFLMRNGATVPIRKNGMKEIRKVFNDFFSERLFEEV